MEHTKAKQVGGYEMRTGIIDTKASIGKSKGVRPRKRVAQRMHEDSESEMEDPGVGEGLI